MTDPTPARLLAPALPPRDVRALHRHPRRISAAAAATLPIALLADLVSIGTAFVFCVVALATMWLRTHEPDLPRPFRVLGGGRMIGGFWVGAVPALAIVLCLSMMAPVLLDIAGRALAGDRVPAMMLGLYVAAGAVVYARYGHRHSVLRRGGSDRAAAGG